MTVIHSLAEVPLFAGLGEADLALVAQQARLRRYREQDTVFHRDDPGVALYVILSGKVKIHSEAPDGADLIIAVLSAGEFFGELAVIDGDERSASATTLEPTELLMLTREDLHTIIRRHPQIGLNLLVTLAGRLRRTTEALRAFSTLDVNGRVAKQLLALGQQHGVETLEGRQIALRLTQSDLAALVGASRETVNKVLGYFRRRGWIAVDEQHRIILLQPLELAKRCEQAT
ncbi:MAG: Crp/Fnr family transcriptional regulator [Armatimonadetes bacterium]|nr:Crp/Fnr family transcriptional regulator [Armatimonadota bacterium]